MDGEAILRVNPNTIMSNTTIITNWNASSVGKITIASGYTVTVASGARWVIL